MQGLEEAETPQPGKLRANWEMGMACGPLVCLISGSLLLGGCLGVCFVSGPRCPSTCRAASSTFLIAVCLLVLPVSHARAPSAHFTRDTTPELSSLRLEWSQNQQSCDQGLGIFGMRTIIVLHSQILSSQPK